MTSEVGLRQNYMTRRACSGVAAKSGHLGAVISGDQNVQECPEPYNASPLESLGANIRNLWKHIIQCIKTV